MTDKEDKNSNLAGWAAVITAIAALITAIGFPSFFPDLVKQIFSSPPPTSQVSPKAEGGTIPSPSPFVSPPKTRMSPAEAVLSLRQRMSYLEARNILFSAGFHPAKFDASNSESENIASDISGRLDQDLPELHHCQSTGLGLCSGEVELEDGRSLSVTVAGIENSPSLVAWNSSFYIEPSKTTLDAAEQLRVGLPYRKVEQFLISEGWQSPIVNPMHRAGELPAGALDFLMEFADFEDCQVDGDEIKSCRFILFTEGERSLTITTAITRVGSQYEPIIQSWSLE